MPLKQSVWVICCNRGVKKQAGDYLWIVLRAYSSAFPRHVMFQQVSCRLAWGLGVESAFFLSQPFSLKKKKYFLSVEVFLDKLTSTYPLLDSEDLFSSKIRQLMTERRTSLKCDRAKKGETKVGGVGWWRRKGSLQLIWIWTLITCKGSPIHLSAHKQAEAKTHTHTHPCLFFTATIPAFYMHISLCNCDSIMWPKECGLCYLSVKIQQHYNLLNVNPCSNNFLPTPTQLDKPHR